MLEQVKCGFISSVDIVATTDTSSFVERVARPSGFVRDNSVGFPVRSDTVVVVFANTVRRLGWVSLHNKEFGKSSVDLAMKGLGVIVGLSNLRKLVSSLVG